jgi:hypothetical protein
MVTLLISAFWAVSESWSVTPHSLKKITRNEHPIKGAAAVMQGNDQRYN